MELSNEFIANKSMKKWKNISCGCFSVNKQLTVSISDEGKISKQINSSKENPKNLKQDSKKNENEISLKIVEPKKTKQIQNLIDTSNNSSRGAKFLSSIINSQDSNTERSSSFVVGTKINNKTLQMLKRSKKKRTLHPNSCIYTNNK